jgi:hypothetical protein
LGPSIFFFFFEEAIFSSYRFVVVKWLWKICCGFDEVIISWHDLIFFQKLYCHLPCIKLKKKVQLWSLNKIKVLKRLTSLVSYIECNKCMAGSLVLWLKFLSFSYFSSYFLIFSVSFSLIFLISRYDILIFVWLIRHSFDFLLLSYKHPLSPTHMWFIDLFLFFFQIPMARILIWSIRRWVQISINWWDNNGWCMRLLFF